MGVGGAVDRAAEVIGKAITGLARIHRRCVRKRLMEGRDVDQYPRSASPRPGGRGLPRVKNPGPADRPGSAIGVTPATRTGDICSICGTITHAVLITICTHCDLPCRDGES